MENGFRSALGNIARLIETKREKHFLHEKHNSTKEGGEPFCLSVYLVAHPVGLDDPRGSHLQKSSWVEPKGRGRPRKKAGREKELPKQPRGRPRKHPLPDPTVRKRPRGRPRKSD